MQGAIAKSAFTGARVVIQPKGRRIQGGRNRAVVTKAKYGDEGKYFDLDVSVGSAWLPFPDKHTHTHLVVTLVRFSFLLFGINEFSLEKF